MRDNAVLLLSGASRVVNNTCMGQSGGGVAVGGNGQAHIEGNSAVCNNSCLHGSGGGIEVTGYGELALVGGSVLCNNTGGWGGGGLAIACNATVTIRNSSIRSNTAYASGGATVVRDGGNVVVFYSTIKNSTSNGDADGSSSLGGGAVAVLDAAQVNLLNGTKLLSNRAVGLPGGAFIVDAQADLVIGAGVQLSGNTVVGNTSSRVVPYGTGGVALKSSKLDIQPGVLGQGALPAKCNHSVVLFRRPCGVAELDGGSGSACVCCPAFTYSFEANVTVCQQCPDNAQCYADVVSPVAGYWHSSPRSLQIHKCPVPKPCHHQGGVCETGHTGNLCGQCAEGYAITLPLQCSRCMAPQF